MSCTVAVNYSTMSLRTLVFTFRGTVVEVEHVEKETLSALALRLALQLDTVPHTLRLLVSGKSIQLQGEATLEDVVPRLPPSLFLLGTTRAEAAAVAAMPALAAARAASTREAPPEHAAAVAQRRAGSLATSSNPVRLPAGPYTFRSFETLPRVDGIPPPDDALSILHRLASDIGIAAVMSSRRYSVGLLSESALFGRSLHTFCYFLC